MQLQLVHCVVRMDQNSERPDTLKDWLTAVFWMAVVLSVLYAVLWAAALASDYFGVTGNFRPAIGIGTVIILLFMWYRPFWALLFALGALGALVAMAAHIVHFQILPAFCFALLAIASGAVAAFLVRNYG